MSEDLVGKTLGKYNLEERIGRGGMAEVYKAYHAALDRYVALKLLHPFLGEDPEFKNRFEREARNVAQLRHPNIVQVYDFEHEPIRDLYYMVMEYVDGATLRTKLMQMNFQNEKFSIIEAIRIIDSLSDALAYAHSSGMVHRDIKPANIMIDSKSRIVLTDFGIARIISGPNMTASGSMIGTPAYMSPEQGLGQSGDHRSDIYSLGIVLFQLLTGSVPFDADTPIAIVLKHVNDPLPPPSRLNPEISPSLERILYKALAKSPDDRYQNIQEISSDLASLGSPNAEVKIPAYAVTSPQFKPILPPAPEPQLHPNAPSFPAIEQPIPTPKAQPKKRRTGCFSLTFALVISLASLIAGIYISVNNILSTYIPFIPEISLEITPTLPVATATPEIQLTTSLEVLPLDNNSENTDALTPTIPPTATPENMICNYDYQISETTPPNLSNYPELTSLTLTFILHNTGNCPLPTGTIFTFQSGLPFENKGPAELPRQLLPDQQIVLDLNLRTPMFNESEPTATSTWVVKLPEGTIIGEPFTLSYTLYPSSDS